MKENSSTDDKRLAADNTHYRWSALIPPRLEIEAGETVVFETGLGGGRRYTVTSTAETVLLKPPSPSGIELTGPVFVRGARPGDVIQIEILEIAIGPWGYTSIEPAFGLLSDEFPHPAFRSWDLSNGRSLQFNPDIEIPLSPFLGTMGVAPPVPFEEDSIPPRKWGGNFDIKQLTAGATLWLPVAVEGALLSVGDAHGAQGDGEVCGTAVETTANARLRISVVRDLAIPAPVFVAASAPDRRRTGQQYCTTGIAPELMNATKEAVRSMISYLQQIWKLSAEDAYILCSLAVDLKISEIVDKPNWVVSACLPLEMHRAWRDRLVVSPFPLGTLPT